MKYNFSDGVRKSLACARDEAFRLQHDCVGTEHILLGVLRDSEVVGILRELGKTAEEIRRAVEARARPGASPVRRSELPYTSRAKMALEFSMAEARELKDPGVETKHLLLGLLREETGIGGEALREFGLTAESVRARKAIVANKPRGEFRPRIDDSSDRSIYEQIVAQITEAAATGDLRPGERLPTVRQLADELDVAPGTVARAYSELERERLVITEGTRGTRIADRLAPPVRGLERPETLAGLLRPVAVAAFHLGASAGELRAALEEAMRGIFDKRDHAA